MTMRATPLATIICLALLALTLGCNPPTSDTGDSSSTGGPTSTTTAVPDEIVLGAYMPNTGPFATFGQSSTKAMRMAVEEINAAGGVLGAQIKLIVEDDQCKPEEAANAAQKLIHQDEVLCVIGEVASSNSLAAAPICQDGKTPMVTPSSTNPEVTRTGDYIFRVCFTDDFQGLVMAKFALDDLSARTAVIFSDIASDYSKGLSKVFRETFTAGGGEILAEESYNQGDRDFRAQLTKFKPLAPDVIYVPGYYGEVAMILSQADQLGLDAALMGGDGWDSPKLVEIAGEAAEGTYFSNHYSKDDPNQIVQDFVANFQAEQGEVPDALAACAYDTVRIVAQAIETAGTVDRDALRDALAQVSDFDGVTGTITIDDERNALKTATILTIENGVQTFVGTIDPSG